MQTPEELKPFILANGTWRENTFSFLVSALFGSRPFMRFPEGIQAAQNYGRILDVILEYIDDTGKGHLIENLIDSGSVGPTAVNHLIVLVRSRQKVGTTIEIECRALSSYETTAIFLSTSLKSGPMANSDK